MSRWQSYALVILIAATVMLTNLGGPRLWDRDEPRNAGCAAEMMARGDWVVPVFNAELRTHKPVLLYWLMMTAYGLFGISEFSARLPSALLAIGTALCTCEMGRHFFSPRAGVWAGISVATSLLFVVAGRAATPDATLIFCSTLAVTVFCLGTEVTSSRTTAEHRQFVAPAAALSWTRAAGMYAAMGLAALAKGPVGVVLPTAVIGLFQLVSSSQPFVERPESWRDWLRNLAAPFSPRHFLRTFWSLRPITAFLVVLGVAAPWYVWVGLRTDGEFLRGFFLEHNLGRAMDTMEGHRGNFLFYPLTLLVGTFPWSIFTIPLGIDLVHRLRQRDIPREGYLLAGCWLAVYLSVFSLAMTKLPSYITPSYPAIGLLVGSFLDRWLRGEVQVSHRWLQAACGVLALIGLAMGIAIPIAIHQKLPGEEWLGVLGAVPLAAGLAAWWSVRREQPQRAVWLVAGGATAFATLAFAVGAARVDRHQMNHRLLNAIQEQSSRPRVAAFGCLEPSWVFYGGRSIDEVTEGIVGPTHLPHVARNGRWLPKPPIRIADLLASEDAPFIITTRAQIDTVQNLLPPDFRILQTVPLFLKNDELVLFGRADSVVIARRAKR